MIDKKEFESAFIKAHADAITRVNTIRSHYEVGVIPADLALEEIGCYLDEFEKRMDDLHREARI